MEVDTAFFTACYFLRINTCVMVDLEGGWKRESSVPTKFKKAGESTVLRLKVLTDEFYHCILTMLIAR